MGALISELDTARELSTALTDETQEFTSAYQAFFASFSEGAKKLKDDLADKKAALTSFEDAWGQFLKQARADRDAALEKLSSHKVATGQIIKLREEISELANQVGDLEAKIKAAGDPSKQLKEAITALRTANGLRTSKTEEWAKAIGELSSGKIDAVVEPEGDISEITDAIELVAAKTGSKEATRLQKLAEAMASEGAVAVCDKLRTDCLSLVHWRQLAAALGEEEPACAELMPILGNTSNIRNAIGEHMDGPRIEAIAVAVTRPRITLSYCDGPKKIAFEKASVSIGTQT